ncbi:MAG: serine hydrolase domain-containing protein [Planctomycetota bacterium]
MLRMLIVLIASTAVAAQPSADYRVVVERERLGSFWGAVLVVDRGEVVLAEGFGLQDPESLDPIDADTLFDIGSVSKPITAIAVLQLVERGQLTLETTMRDLFGDLAGEDGDAITIRHLLTHTAGLDDRRALQRLDLDDRDEAVRLALAAPRQSPPGERWAYSNAGYVLLAAAIEVATGQGFEAVVREGVFEPAGMTASGFLDGRGVDGPLDGDRFSVRQVMPQGRRIRRGLLDDGWGWGLRGAGGVLTSAGDLARLHTALLASRDGREGALLRPESIERMDLVAIEGPVPMALGWIGLDAPDGTPKRSHGGSTRGFLAEWRRYPDRGATIAVLTNTDGDPRGLADALEAELLGIAPSRVDVEIHREGVAFNRHDHGTVSEPSFDIKRADDEIVLTAEGDRGVALVLRMSEVTARRAAASLVSIAEMDLDNAVNATSLGLGTRPYEASGDRLVIDDDWLELRVQPDYNRQPGPTLIVDDPARGFWPVLLRLSDEDAATLTRLLGG